MEKIIINGVEIDPQYYIDKWTNWALEATPATDEQVIANVKTLYKKAGIQEPEVVVFRDYEKFLKTNSASVRASVGASVRVSVWASVRDSVRASVWASVGASVGDSVRVSVWDSVRDPVRASVGNSVGVSVRASVRDSVRDPVGDSVWASVGASVGAWYWVDDMALADVFVDSHVLTKEKTQELEEYKKLLETQRVAILTEKVAYVLVAPTIRRNEEGQLHCDQRPAVEWENETGQYYLDGVNLPKQLWKKIISKQMTFGEIMKIEISDQRTVALKYNPEAIIKEHAILLDKDNRNNELYLIENQEINKITNFPKMYFLKMICPTGRTFVEGCNPEWVDTYGANASTMQALLCGLTPSEYQHLVYES